MKKPYIGLIVLLFICTNAMAQFDFEGHRGARGLLPENTIPAFIKALDLGVTTLEMDVVISKDKKVVVSHDPFFNHEFTTTPEGKKIRSRQHDEHLLYHMNYEDIKKYDVGKRNHSEFPEQVSVPAYKPLLSEVLTTAERHVKNTDRDEVYYNIEIKAEEEWDMLYTPPVDEFCELVVKTVNAYVPMHRVILQSFDPRVLEYLHQHYPQIRLAFLVENKQSIQENLKKLSFKPPIYSPEYFLLKKKDVKWLHANDFKVIPWTVNDKEEMEKLVEWGVDGLISDYPDRLMIIKKEMKLHATSL